MMVATDDVSFLLEKARKASHAMAVLATDEKNRALEEFARQIEESQSHLLDASRRDQDLQKGRIADSLFQRLILDESKLRQLVDGIRGVCRLPDPVGRVLSRTRLDDGLILDKETVPIGVIGIVFESRPDVIPQILSLILKSGNAVVLKGGHEARHSNRAFMAVVERLQQSCPWLPQDWAVLLESREAVHEMLKYPQFVDLVIPRGSNKMVRSIMNATQIPVLGHAEGICHIYVDAAADPARAVSVVVDAKAQYAAVCNAVETVLVDRVCASRFLPLLGDASKEAGITLKGCERTRRILPWVETASEKDWSREYGDCRLNVRILDGIAAAIEHINHYGSHHTDCILTDDPEQAEYFLNRVDSASVFSNASTRFADGYRYGLGAELGISTNRTHARGPVGLEGLVIYKFKLRGSGQIVSDYVGEQAREFKHEPMVTD